MDISTKIGLPNIKPIRLRGEVDYYGLSSILAKHARRAKPPRSFATWRHGWVFAPLRYVEQLIWTDHEAPVHLVATPKEASFLASHGVQGVIPAGLPFIYADLQGIERIPNSLLVMPPHSLSYTLHGMDESAYVEYIKSISKGFSLVLFCLHQACAEKGRWCQVLSEAGFDWVVGAAAHDANSLIRMQKIFRTFDYMTTCTIGSHVVYGAYCGCKVSIAGGFVELNREAFANDPYYLSFPEILTHDLLFSNEMAIRSICPFLFVDPPQAICLIDWAAAEVGASHRKNVEELQEYLGWSACGQVRLWLYMLKKYASNPSRVAEILRRCFEKRKLQ